MQAKKSLGQNFLMHPQIAERIVHAAGVTARDTVFEIGPGTGMLTRALIAQTGKVIAVEADGALYEKLSADFSADIEAGKLELHHADIRTFSIESLPEGYLLVANIPYYLTGDIMRRFLTSARQPRAMTLLVQKEVAERIAREKKESLLSLSVKAYGVPRYEFTVPRGAFLPQPNVDSAVLSIRDISRAHFASKNEEERFFTLIRAGFAHKRKWLSKNLADAGFSITLANPKVRAEDMPLADWLALARAS